MCATNQAIPRIWNPALPLEEMRIPARVKKEAQKKADAKSIAWLVWLQEYDGTLLARVFAAKKKRVRAHWDSRPVYDLKIIETMRELIGTPIMVERNIWCNPCGGWTCYFPEENEVGDFNWHSVHTDQRPGVYMKLINPEAVTKCERFRFCGWREDTGVPLASYLNAWLENPGVEYFGKLGLIPKKSLVQKATKDGNFRKWLRSLTPEQIRDANCYGPNATLQAFKFKCDIRKAYATANDHRQRMNRIRNYAAPVMKYFSAEKIEEYMTEEATGHEYGFAASYADYIDACVYLGLDLKDTKVAFPREFDRMHDLRIDEMRSKQEKADRKTRRKLYRDFKNAAESLKRFEQAAGIFCIVIPDTPMDLIREGKKLHHCVGHMGYDKKMAEGRDFIAFLRKADNAGLPFVTIEYNLKEKKLQQCYGDHDSRPEAAAQAFAEAWAAMVTETLRREEHEKRVQEAAAAEEEERQRILRSRKEATA